MAKLDGYSYPKDLDPDEAEQLLDTLVNEFGGVASNREAYAQALGHKTKNSGSFTRKIADARKYRLISPRGDYEATELGFRLANPRSERERNEAKYEMIANLDLLSEVYNELNGKQPPEQFWRVLHEMLDINPKEARDSAPRIEELYRKMLRVDVDDEEEYSEVDTSSETDGDEPTDSNIESQSSKDEVSTVSADAALYLRIGDDEIRFSEVNDIHIQLLQQFLESKRGDSESNSDGIQTTLHQ